MPQHIQNITERFCLIPQSIRYNPVEPEHDFSPREKADYQIYELGCYAKTVSRIAALNPEFINKAELLEASFLIHKALAAIEDARLGDAEIKKWALACR